MHDRRQAYRFRASPGEDQATVTAGELSVSAQIIDTSATGLSLKIDARWPGNVGQKLELDLNGEVCTLAEVVRIEHEGESTFVGLRRLEDQHWEEAGHSRALPIREMLKRRRRHRLPGAQVPAGILLLIVGMVIGIVVWGPNRSKTDPSQQKQPPPVVQPRPTKVEQPTDGERRTTASKAAAAQPVGSSSRPVSGPPSPVISIAKPAPTAGTHPAPADAGSSTSESIQLDQLLPKLPRSTQFQFRQLETKVQGARSHVNSLQAQREIQDVMERLEKQLAALFQQSSEDEAAFSRAAQPAIEEAGRQIDALRGK